MRKVLAAAFVIGLIALPISIFGCKGKTQEAMEGMDTEQTEPMMQAEEIVVTQVPVTEPSAAQILGQENIPPTASFPSQTAKTSAVLGASRTMDIQTALKTAGFYADSIDGKLGPKTKRAIIEFQKAKGLKADGKVGPKTWAELEKYLNQ